VGNFGGNLREKMPELDIRYPPVKFPCFPFSLLLLVMPPLIGGEILFEDPFGQALSIGRESGGAIDAAAAVRTIGPSAPKSYP
jgi:hypothetical protein